MVIICGRVSFQSGQERKRGISEDLTFPAYLFLTRGTQIFPIYRWLIFQSHGPIKTKGKEMESKCATSQNSQKTHWDD